MSEPMVVTIPLEVWSRIVFAAKESPDARLAQMVEQAVMDARVAPPSATLPQSWSNL